MKKTCVITGGTRGIGYYLAHGFLEAGYCVYVIDYLQHQEIDQRIHFIQVDIRDEAAIQYAFNKITKELGCIHVLINNAAIANFNKPIQEITIREFDDVMNVNLRGSFICSKYFIEANLGAKYGRIINIASTRWNQNEANWEAYGASKGALVSLTNTLAISLSNTNITVNAISPGWIQVEDYALLSESDHCQHPSGRVGKPSDIVTACLFLADEANSFINAHNLVIDGGMSKKMIYEE